MLGSLGPKKRLFTLFGFPISADLGAAILALLVLSYGGRSDGALRLVEGAITLLVIFGSIVLHEIGHAIAVRRLGYGESTIVLSGLGGVTQWRGRPNRKDQIKVSLAGPAVSLALAAFGFALRFTLGGTNALLMLFASYVAFLNLFWAVFNLLPVYPMDGGKATRAWLEGRFRGLKGKRLSLQVSGGTAVAIGVLGFLQGYIFVAFYMGWITMNNWNEWQALPNHR